MPRKKNAAALALAEISRKKRMRTMTAAQRSEQGKKAVAARRDRQPAGPWFGLVVLPADYVWKGTKHASKVLDEAMSDSGKVVFWSQNRADVVKRSNERDLRDRTTIIIEQDWDPTRVRMICEYQPDAAASASAKQRVLDANRAGGRA